MLLLFTCIRIKLLLLTFLLRPVKRMLVRIVLMFLTNRGFTIEVHHLRVIHHLQNIICLLLLTKCYEAYSATRFLFPFFPFFPRRLHSFANMAAIPPQDAIPPNQEDVDAEPPKFHCTTVRKFWLQYKAAQDKRHFKHYVFWLTEHHFLFKENDFASYDEFKAIFNLSDDPIDENDEAAVKYELFCIQRVYLEGEGELDSTMYHGGVSGVLKYRRDNGIEREF